MIMYLLDTNAISEPFKKQPNAGFMAWFNDVEQGQLCISCLTLGELHKGRELIKPQGQRLQAFIDEVAEVFIDTTIPVTADVAIIWGSLMANGQKQGKTPSAVDALLAAQCIKHNLTLVTRNVRDFEQFTGLTVLNLWA